MTQTQDEKRLDGRALAAQIRARLARQLDERVAAGRARPGLAVVLVGTDAASQIYVASKVQACKEAGFRSSAWTLPAGTAEQELLALIAQLNADDEVHGILVQLPLPAHIDVGRVIEAIRVDKDVDGFHPCNLGRLAARAPLLRPCTPKGCMTLLHSAGVECRGRRAVVVGASPIVGRPMALELLLADATVVICHRYTETLQREVRDADILVTAAGCPRLIPGDWIKPGAVVIDVGINRLADGSLCGDVDYAAARERAALITPVPGGVGPMTIASLLENTLQACELQEAQAVRSVA